MKPSKELSEPLQLIGRKTLGIDLNQDAATLENMSVSDLRQALQMAYDTGHEAEQKEGIESNLLFWQLMESLPDHVFFKDRKSRFTCINHSLAHFFGFKHPGEAIGKSDFDQFQNEYASAKFEAEQEIIRTGKGWYFKEERDLQSDGSEKWVLTTKLPLRNANGEICGTFGLSRDITNQKRAELELDRQHHLLDAIIKIMPCRIFVRDADDRFVMINEEYRKAFDLKTREEVVGKKISDIRDNDQARRIEAMDAEIIRTGEPVINELEFNQSLLGKQRWVLNSKVPLIGPDGTPEGIVGMTHDITEQKLAEERAHATGEALAKKNQQFETELFVARQLQEQLMSIGFDERPMYTRNGSHWNLEASYLYTPSHHLAGDFFYLIPISENQLGILVCDVMGHGIKAALVTMLIRGLMLETHVLLSEPGKVLQHLNEALTALAEDEEFPRFVTALYTVIDLDKGEVHIANAGHPAPIWRVQDSSGTHFELCPVDKIGPALGLIPEESFNCNQFPLTDMTEFLFFTDGIIEQKTKSGEEWGVENLEEAVLDHESDELPEQLRAIAEELKEVAGAKELEDDVCIIAVRLSPTEQSS
ncbi:MAG: SpoIIE family protein phosphatase [Opitutaceae bacterium]|nr:SpoIIE family protein phosphatase [Opitutaceae bacterium]